MFSDHMPLELELDLGEGSKEDKTLPLLPKLRCEDSKKDLYQVKLHMEFLEMASLPHEINEVDLLLKSILYKAVADYEKN